jgi:AraC-like DNA-binding protein
MLSQVRFNLAAATSPADAVGPGLSAEAARVLDDFCHAARRDSRCGARGYSTPVRACRDAEHGAVGNRRPGTMAKAQCRIVPDSLPVDELAALASLSVSHFCRAFRQICRAFRQTFGERPYAYIVRLRLQGAQELMLSGRDRLGQLPLACGFAEQAHFTKAFRRELDEASSACRRHVVDAACPHRCVRRYPRCWRFTATFST